MKIFCIDPCITSTPGSLPTSADPVLIVSELPAGGLQGEVLVYGAEGAEWGSQGVYPVTDLPSNVTLTESMRNQINEASEAITVSIPANATNAIEIGSLFTFTRLAGAVTFSAAVGVFVNGVEAGDFQINPQWGTATLYKRAINSWVISGSVLGVP